MLGHYFVFPGKPSWAIKSFMSPSFREELTARNKAREKERLYFDKTFDNHMLYNHLSADTRPENYEGELTDVKSQSDYRLEKERNRKPKILNREDCRKLIKEILEDTHDA